MSTKYKIADQVPSDILCRRLDELSSAVTKGEAEVRRVFYMSIPAQCDHDADLVLAAASKRIQDLEAKNNKSLKIDGLPCAKVIDCEFIEQWCKEGECDFFTPTT